MLLYRGFFGENSTGVQHAHISQISQDMGVRVSRAIEGEKTLGIEEVTSTIPVYLNDVIGVRCAKPWSEDGLRNHPFDEDAKGSDAEVSVNGRDHARDGARFSL